MHPDDHWVFFWGRGGFGDQDLWLDSRHDESTTDWAPARFHGTNTKRDITAALLKQNSHLRGPRRSCIQMHAV